MNTFQLTIHRLIIFITLLHRQNATTVMPQSQQDNYQQTKLILPQNGGQSSDSISLPHQDSIINISQNMDIQHLSPMSGERLQTIATNHSQPKYVINMQS